MARGIWPGQNLLTHNRYALMHTQVLKNVFLRYGPPSPWQGPGCHLQVFPIAPPAVFFKKWRVVNSAKHTRLLSYYLHIHTCIVPRFVGHLSYLHFGLP